MFLAAQLLVVAFFTRAERVPRSPETLARIGQEKGT
jgi:hypothetical protein